MKLPLLLLLFCFGALACGQETANSLTSEEKEAGYRLLFDGTRLAFKGVQKSNFLQSGWKIDQGTLTLTKTVQQSGKVTGGDLATVEAFTDFEFLFEWKMGVSGNSGVLYFAKTSLGSKPTGSEFQLIDDVHHPDGLKGGPIRRSGALYGVLPPSDAKKLNVDWNKGRLVVQGNHVEHWINDEKVLEYEIGSPTFQQAIKASTLKLPMTFGTKTRGPILLLDEGEEVSFRNLKIKVPAAPVIRG